GPTLDGEPVRISHQVIITRERRTDLLRHRDGPIRHVEPEKLGKIRTSKVARRVPTEEGLRSHAPSLFRSPKRGEGGEISSSLLNEGVGIVRDERDVAGQGLPVEFGHLGSFFGTAKGGRSRHAEVVRIWPFQC